MVVVSGHRDLGSGSEVPAGSEREALETLWRRPLTPSLPSKHTRIRRDASEYLWSLILHPSTQHETGSEQYLQDLGIPFSHKNNLKINIIDQWDDAS